MKEKNKMLDEKAQERLNMLISKGFQKREAERRALSYRKEIKEKLDKEERTYWKNRQDKKFGKVSDIGQEEGKDYLKCLRKR